jgi:hypothetical protein
MCSLTCQLHVEARRSAGQRACQIINRFRPCTRQSGVALGTNRNSAAIAKTSEAWRTIQSKIGISSHLSDSKPDRSTNTDCQIEFQLMHLNGVGG